MMGVFDKGELLARLREEAQARDAQRQAPRSIKGAWTDEEMGLRPGAYSSKAAFLTESDEDTKMWGDSGNITFTGPEPQQTFLTAQLVHVHRKRPATFQTLVTINLGQGWTGEGAFTILVAYLVGVGQAKTSLVIPITVATPTNGTQFFDARQIPVTALQIQVGLFGTSTIAGAHDALVTALVAPVTP